MCLALETELFDTEHKPVHSYQTSHSKNATMSASTFLIRSGEHLTIEVRLDDQYESIVGLSNGTSTLASLNHPGESAQTFTSGRGIFDSGSLSNSSQHGGVNSTRSSWQESPHRILAFNADTWVTGFKDQGREIRTSFPAHDPENMSTSTTWYSYWLALLPCSVTKHDYAREYFYCLAGPKMYVQHYGMLWGRHPENSTPQRLDLHNAILEWRRFGLGKAHMHQSI